MNLDDTDLKDGLITIKTFDSEYVKLNIGSYTTIDTLDEGVRVCVEVGSLGATGTLYAKNVASAE
ncbi:MAG: hypothetical protein ACFFBJ_02115 [Promethearchaeota archaeon]